MLGIFLTLCVLFRRGVSGVETDRVTVKEGDSVTLNTNVKINQKDRIRWFFENTRIAQIIGNSICTDVQCKDGDERLRDRLKLDHVTGSLTITNIRNTDTGLYELQITSNTDSLKIFNVTVSGAGVSVIEGDSVTLHTDVETNQQDRIMWYFNITRIAQIIGGQSKICREDQCKEMFRDRLELDHQTGSLTITNTRITDSGLYYLQINSRNSEKTFNIAVHDVPAAERDEVKRKSLMEGESVSLDPGVMKNPNDSVTWYFNDILIAEITGDQSQICTDDQCKERFRDRLKLDLQTGSLTITNTKTTDSGDHQLKIISRSSRFSITTVKRFSVSVTASGSSSAAAAIVVVVVVVVLLLVVAAAAAFYFRKRQADELSRECTRRAPNLHENELTSTQTDPLMKNGANGTSPTQTDPLMRNGAIGTSPNLTDPLMKNAANGIYNISKP